MQNFEYVLFMLILSIKKVFTSLCIPLILGRKTFWCTQSIFFYYFNS